MRQMKARITTLSPIVLTAMGSATVLTETNDSVSGSILRGVLAKKYIETQGIKDNAHENEAFRRLFFGSLRFVDANLADKDDSKERRSFRLPFSLQKEKAKDNSEGKSKNDKALPIEDLMWEENPSSGMKSLSGYAVLKDNRIQTVSPKKSISMHMSRANDQERCMGRSNDGGIYNYEALDAGQIFIGLVLGEEDDLKALRDAVPQSFDCHIGRSKFAQYGHCSLEIGEIENVYQVENKDLNHEKNNMILRFDTPYLPETSGDTLMTAVHALDAVAAEMNERTGSSGFSVSHIHAAGTEIDNYIGVWGMKRPREAALAAGTVFALEKEGDWTPQDFEAISAMMHEGVGRRTEEGFGQLRIWAQPDGIYEKPKKQLRQEREALLANVTTASQTVAETARKIFARRLQDQLRVYAAEDVGEIPDGRLAGFTHFFSRLDQMLVSVGAKAGNRDAYSRLLKDKVRPKSPFEGNLHKVAIKGRLLYDLLLENRDVPYADRDWKTELSGKKETTVACMKAIGLEENTLALNDGAYFYEYWHWFFRYARKKASADQRKEVMTHA